MRSQHEPAEAVLALLIALAIGAIVLMVSRATGLTFYAAFSALLGFVLALVVLGIGWWQQQSHDPLFTLRGTLPTAGAIVWLGLWPTLQ